jgi:flagellar biosynthesis/type III secretory pathway M-ring protein FliF/YscJ
LVNELTGLNHLLKKLKQIIMKNLFFFIALLFSTVFTFAQDIYVKGYYKSNGTYIQGHYRTAPSTNAGNYATVSNVNPYTGKTRTQPGDSYPTTSNTSSNYIVSSYKRTYTPSHTAPTTYSNPSYSPRPTIYTGSSGGQYYINSNGNKSYVSN